MLSIYKICVYIYMHIYMHIYIYAYIYNLYIIYISSISVYDLHLKFKTRIYI